MTKRKFRLDRENGKLWGVCAGIARYMGWDATLVRVGAVLVTLIGAFPWTLIAYGAAALIAKPKSRDEGDEAPRGRISTYDLKASMRDIDRRMAEVDHYVTSTDGRLAREIESLR